jgi:hypothetical protein
MNALFVSYRNQWELIYQLASLTVNCALLTSARFPARIFGRSMTMATSQPISHQPLQEANYSESIAKAIEWLGDRYLLAQPIKLAPSLEILKIRRISLMQRQLETASYRQWLARSTSGFVPHQ